MAIYCAATPGVRGGTDGSVRLDQENEPQPDVFLMLPAAAGGRTRLDVDDYVSGAPELVLEVAASNASRDLHAKRKACRRNGVREYVVWRVNERIVDWFVLRDSEYVALTPDPDGMLRGEVFPGLWLDLEALIQGDLARVLAGVQRGIGSPEHREFVARLASGAG